MAWRETRGEATRAHVNACVMLRWCGADAWQGLASPRERVGGVYVGRGSLGWQVMGPRVVGSSKMFGGGNANAQWSPMLNTHLSPLNFSMWDYVPFNF